MTSHLADRVPFDPASGGLPDALGPLAARISPGSVIVVCAPSSAEAGMWRGRTAVALARRWTGEGSRLFLMDLCLENPVLHHFLGMENGEGVADIFAFGASLGRVARPVDEGRFHFVPAGTATAHSGDILSHSRWDRLIQGIRDAAASVVVYLPLDLEGAEGPLERADHVVLLDGAGEGLDRWSGKVVAHLVPAAAGEAGPSVPAADVAEAGEPLEPAGAPEAVASEPPSVPEAVPEPEKEVVAIAALAPDRPTPGATPEEEIVEIAALAPEAVDVATLAPEPEAPEHPAESTPPPPAAEPEASPPAAEAEVAPPDAVPEVVEIEDLAPEPAAPEPAVESQAPVAEEAPSPTEVIEIGDLAPDAPRAAEAPASAGPPALDEAEEAPPAFGETAEPVEGTPAGEAADEGFAVADDLEAAVEEEAFGRAVEEPEVAEEEAPEPEAPAEPEVEPEPEAEPGGAAGEAEASATEDQAEGGEFGDWDLDALDAYSAEAAAEEAAGDAAAPVPKWGEWEEEEEEEPDEEEAPDAEGSLGETQAWEGPIPEVEEEEAAEAGETGKEFGEELVQGPDFGSADSAGAWEDEGGGPAQPSGGTGTVAEPEPTPADRRVREREAGEAAAAEAERAEAPRRERPRRRPRRRERKPSFLVRLPRILAVLLLLGLGTVALHWFDLVRVPGMDRALVAVLGPVRAGRAPIVDTSGTQPETPVLGYSLSVDTYRDAATVRDVATALGDRLPELNFVVSPVEIDGELVYRLLAGPATTAEEAESLRTPLSRVLSREDPSRWTARISYLAFVVDETGSLEGARGRRDEIREAGIPAYVLEVVYPDESVRYRVYSGAYENPQEARALRALLAGAGFPDVTFTERRGRLPE